MTKEQIKQNAEDYSHKYHHHRDGMATPRQTMHTMELSYIHGAESRQPEIDYLTDLIRDLLISMSGTCTRDFTDDTKELLKEAAHYINMEITL